MNEWNFYFNGNYANNLDVVVKEYISIPSTQELYDKLDIIGRNGSIYNNKGLYEDKQFTVTLRIRKPLDDFWGKVDRIKKWLYDIQDNIELDNNNLNAKSQASFKGQRPPEEYIMGYIENFWQDDPKYWEDNEKDEDEQEENLVQDALDDLHKQDKIPASSLQFVPVNTMKRITCAVSFAEVHQMARYKAFARFNTEFTTQIKPNIQKKYRLKL